MDDLIGTTAAVLSTGASRWRALADTVPEALFSRRPQLEEWSARECLAHLLDVERDILRARLAALLAGAESLPGFDPTTQGTDYVGQSSVQLADEFARWRGENLHTLAQVTDADLTRTAIHDELGRITLGELVANWAGHELMHLIQAERAILQPFIAACGPWRTYFIDHEPPARQGTSAH